MALTITPVRGAHTVGGTMRGEMFDITFDTSYPTGGYAVTARDFGIGAAIFGIIEAGQGLVAGTATTVNYKLGYDPGTKKIQLFVSAADTVALTEVAAAVNLATRKIRVLVFGV